MNVASRCRSKLWLRTLGGCVCVLLGAFSPARAAPRGDTRIVIAPGSLAGAQALEAALVRKLGPTAVSVHLAESVDVEAAVRDEAAPEPPVEDASASPSTTPTPLVRVWIDLSALGSSPSGPRATRLVFEHPSQARFAIRQLPIEGAFTDVERESIVIMVEVAVEALLRGATFDLSRAEAEAKLRELRPPPPPPPPLVQSVPAAPPVDEATIVVVAGAHEREAAWTLLARYQGVIFDPGQVTFMHGPGLALERSARRWAFDLQGRYLMPAEAERDPLGLGLRGAGVRLGGAWFAGRTWAGAWAARLSAGVDVTWATPKITEPVAVRSAEARTAARPALSPALGWVSPVFGRGADKAGFVLALELFADVDVLGTGFYVDTPEGRRPVVAPLRVRPGLALSVGWGSALAR